MKKWFSVIIVLISGAGLLGSLRLETAQQEQRLSSLAESKRIQQAECAAARSALEKLEQELRQLRDEARAVPALPDDPQRVLDSAVTLALKNQALTPEQIEALLAELGFSWNSTANYVIVTKQTLGKVSLEGMKGPKLTDAACGVLAVSPTERAAIERTAQKIFDDYATYLKAHAKRLDPAGGMICGYNLELETDYTQRAHESFTAQVLATLGPERGALFLGYATEWMRAMGMLGSEPTTLTVHLSQIVNNERRYNYTLKSRHSTMTTSISPWQPFPEAFKPLFPGGWKDLATAEGFELPQEFKQHQAR